MRQALRGSSVRASRRYGGGAQLIGGAGGTVLDEGTIPAPYKGWDAISPLEAMDPASAVILDNWFPEPAYVRFRGGSASWATGLGAGPVETLFPYHGITTNKLFAARGTSIFDVTATGAVGAAAVAGLTNARWQQVMQSTAGGQFLFIVNGADAPRTFDGTSWATPAISGITASNAVHVNVHKRRIWMVLKDSTKAAYLPVDSIAGAATTFDFGSLMTLGGYLVAMGTWTMDSGWGPDDFAVFITSRGQAIVYAGTDPSSSDTWAIKGVYNVGAPIGRRCFAKVGGDLAVITVDGVISLAQAISMDRAAVQRVAITNKIQRAMNTAAKSAKDNFGWELVTYAKGTACYLNVPLTEATLQHQYVMNTIHGAWCRYTGQNANCWAVFNDRLYFGGAGGVVYESDKGNKDGTNLIVADLQTAFNHLRSRGVTKEFSLMRALMKADGLAIPQLILNTDYGDTAAAALASAYAASGAKWNAFNWNDGSQWSGSLVQLADWITVNGAGSCAAVRMRLAPNNTSSALAITLQVNGFELKWQRSQGAL
jgi:hypothetical protein